MEKVFIIAEAGVNHNNNLDIAKKLIDEAVNVGADAIKFQSFKTENLVTVNAARAAYQDKNTNNQDSQFTMLKKLELSNEYQKELKEYADLKNIMFLSSPFDLDSIDVLEELNVPIYKIPSGEILNVPYVEKIAHLGKPIIMSTGMSDLKEIEFALKTLKDNGAKDITILHCTTEYPTPLDEVNLKAMLTIQNTFDVPVGYSDHTEGIEVPIAAVAMGAKVIEKHFTLDKTMQGPDHKASADVAEFKRMVEGIRKMEIMLGDGIKKPTKTEEANIQVVRKSIVASRDIKKGEAFDKTNITTKRPAGGISSQRWHEVIGSIANKDYRKDEFIRI